MRRLTDEQRAASILRSREYQRAWRKANAEKCAASRRRWLARNPQYQKAHYVLNKEHHDRKMREWYVANKDAHTARLNANHDTPGGRAKRLMLRAVTSSKKRGHPAPDLDHAELTRRLAIGKCEVTGLPLDFTRIGAGRGRNPFAPSLDRIDNDLPYTMDNVRIVCWGLNAGLAQWGMPAYMSIARAAVERELA